jgi:hypothetical protein
MSEAQETKDSSPRERGLVAKVLEGALIGAVESIARALAKGAESIVTDMSKVAGIQKKKIDAVANGIKTWREMNVGEIRDSDGDVPTELRD